MDKYLGESEQIKITDLVRKHAQKALKTDINEGKDTHPNLQKAYKVSKYRYSLPKMKGYVRKPKDEVELKMTRDTKDRVFRKRTLQEILKQGIYPTCSDIGIVFRGLMITLGVPTTYIETFHEDYLFGKKFHGHVIGKILVGNKWYFVDPQNNEKRVVKTEEELFPLIVFREGLDSWDVGIKGYDDMHKLKREHLNELLDKYQDVVAKVFKQKIQRAKEIMHNPELSKLK